MICRSAIHCESGNIMRSPKIGSIPEKQSKQSQSILQNNPTYFLERTLLFSFVIHGVAMLSMVLLLLAGMPGGPHNGAARIAYIASYPWLWRLGRFTWQLTAFSDLLIAFALLRTKWIPRVPAVLTLI